MSRIGKQPITIPATVTLNIAKSSIEVKGPKGSLTQPIHPDMQLKSGEGELLVMRPTNQKRHKALHGLTRALIQNMVIGTTTGFKKSLEVIGIGYKASMLQKNVLELHLGKSHITALLLPSEVTAEIDTKTSKNPRIHVTSNDKQLLGQVVAKIRSQRPPEPYKGKGIRFLGEQVRRKAGKTASK